MRHLPLRAVPSLALTLVTATAARAQLLTVCDTTNARVLMLDGGNGAVVDKQFLDLSETAAVPIECVLGPGALYVADSASGADAILIYSVDGTLLLGSTTIGIDNLLGIEFANGTLYACNEGAASFEILMFDPSGAPLGSFPTPGAPADILEFQGELLVTDGSHDDILRYDYAGNFLGVFHDSNGVDGIDTPQGMSVRTSTGGLLAAGPAPPIGAFEYDASGAQVDYVELFGFGWRDAYELGDGTLLVSGFGGIAKVDLSSGQVTTIVDGVSAAYIEPYLLQEIGDGYCGPANLNSTGASAEVTAFGSTFVSSNTVHLRSVQLPPNEFGYYLNSMTQGFVPFPGNSQGNLCLSGAIGRYTAYTMSSGAAGEIELALDLTQTPTPPGFVAIQPGETWNFQLWFRDGMTSNFTDGVSIVFL